MPTPLMPADYPHGYGVSVLYQSTYPALGPLGTLVDKPWWIWDLLSTACGTDLMRTAAVAAQAPGGPPCDWPPQPGALLAVWRLKEPPSGPAGLLTAGDGMPRGIGHDPTVLRAGSKGGQFTLVPRDQHPTITMASGGAS